MPPGLEFVPTATGNSLISPQTGLQIVQEQTGSTNLSKGLCTQCPVTGEKVKERARDFACSVQNVLAALVLQEAPSHIKSPKETENCLHLHQIKLCSGRVEPRDWRNALARKMAQIPSSARSSEELQQIITDRLAKGPPGYVRRLQEGLKAFLSQSADVPSKACKPVTDAIRESLKKHDSVSKKLFASAESTDQVLNEVYKWCKGRDLPGTKGPESGVTQRSERVRIMALLANASDDPGEKKDVMQIVATAFTELPASGDLNNWLLCLGPANKAILGWTDLLPENADREEIKRRVGLIDQARLEVDPVRWEANLKTWVAGAGPDENRLEASKKIKKIIEFGFDSAENTVDLSNLNLKTLPGAIGCLKDAKPKQLIFGGNELESLPDSVALLTDVTYIDLGFNKLKTLPESIAALTKMRALLLSHNELVTLPAWIGSLNLLSELLICENRFQRFPILSDTALPNLGNVTIDDCYVKKLRKSIQLTKATIYTEKSPYSGYPVGKQSASCEIL
jgi:Leucine rich repeat